jgi:hypothetical protein
LDKGKLSSVIIKWGQWLKGSQAVIWVFRVEQGQSIAGINLFADYESKSKHKRGSVGLEYQRANFNLNVNKYE